ncbi:tRNA pseudouridine38-40 synthase [Marmoricola sp. OAE513]|uniref:tRNA pseudouridine(38-40) synthase TruA n=1 Tax=Marmoricola sp. OAE513 TaxID=2817894 RepID=UPI001AE30C70
MRLRLDLAYDGSAFHGWARQPGLRTVQGELEAALDTVLRTSGTTLTVAGRTDTGVHARGQVAHVDLDDDALDRMSTRAEPASTDALLRRVNGVVAADVRLHRVAEAPAGFDARFGALWRRYAYRIADDPALVDPLSRSHVVAWPRALDLDAMNEASAHLLGLHDFAAFCKKRAGATTIRSLTGLGWERVDGILVATVQADAFCHSMVRSLVGALTVVGEGRREAAWLAEVLSAKERDSAIIVAHAHGLTLEEVAYPEDADLEAQATGARRRRTLGD